MTEAEYDRLVARIGPAEAERMAERLECLLHGVTKTRGPADAAVRQLRLAAARARAHTRKGVNP